MGGRKEGRKEGNDGIMKKATKRPTCGSEFRGAGGRAAIIKISLLISAKIAENHGRK